MRCIPRHLRGEWSCSVGATIVISGDEGGRIAAGGQDRETGVGRIAAHCSFEQTAGWRNELQIVRCTDSGLAECWCPVAGEIQVGRAAVDDDVVGTNLHHGLVSTCVVAVGAELRVHHHGGGCWDRSRYAVSADADEVGDAGSEVDLQTRWTRNSSAAVVVTKLH